MDGASNLDTFQVSKKSITNVGDLVVGFTEPQCYLPVRGFSQMVNNDSTLNAIISLNKDKRRDHIYSLYLSLHSSDALFEHIDTIGDIRINGVDYTDNFAIQNNSSKGEPLIDQAKFNKEFGLIQYMLKDNTTWTLHEIMKND